MLHGWNLTSEKFQPLIHELRRNGFQAEATDLPGFGESAMPKKELYLDDYVNFVEELIQKKKWKNAIIIGHSFGGRIAIKLAANKPGYLRAVVLTGAPGYSPVPKLKIIFYLFLAKLGNKVFAPPVLSNIREISRKFLYKIAKAQDFYNTDRNMRNTFRNIVNQDLKGLLPDISIPTLIIWGTDDQITPVWIGKKMAHDISCSVLKLIPNARHGVPWTHPEEFTIALNNFLQTV